MFKFDDDDKKEMLSEFDVVFKCVFFIKDNFEEFKYICEFFDCFLYVEKIFLDIIILILMEY